MTDEIRFSFRTLKRLPAAHRKAVLAAAAYSSQAEAEEDFDSEPVAAEDSTEENREDLARFSDKQMREFVKGVGPKTRTVLEAIAKMKPRFQFSELLARLNIDESDWRELRGVWGGLTKRARTITNDGEVSFIIWSKWNPPNDVVDAVGEIDPSTHASLRKALGT